MNMQMNKMKVTGAEANAPRDKGFLGSLFG